MTRKINRKFALFALLILSACGEGVHYDKSYAFENRQWDISNKPRFEVKIDDITQAYDFQISFRTTTDYPYKNMWIFLNTETPEGLKVREPYELKIMDDQGNWLGKNSGSMVETSLLFRNRVFSKKGTYTYTIEQGITESVLKEVSDLNFSVVKHKK